MSAWFYLVIAGLLEAGWAIGLKYTAGFTRLVPSVLTISAIGCSLWLLSLAVRTLPMGTAYPIWVGIGATGAACLGVVLLGEPMSPARAFFLGLIVVSIVGLKLTQHDLDSNPQEVPSRPAATLPDRRHERPIQ